MLKKSGQASLFFWSLLGLLVPVSRYFLSCCCCCIFGGMYVDTWRNTRLLRALRYLPVSVCVWLSRFVAEAGYLCGIPLRIPAPRLREVFIRLLRVFAPSRCAEYKLSKKYGKILLDNSNTRNRGLWTRRRHEKSLLAVVGWRWRRWRWRWR